MHWSCLTCLFFWLVIWVLAFGWMTQRLELKYDMVSSFHINVCPPEIDPSGLCGWPFFQLPKQTVIMIIKLCTFSVSPPQSSHQPFKKTVEGKYWVIIYEVIFCTDRCKKWENYIEVSVRSITKQILFKMYFIFRRATNVPVLSVSNPRALALCCVVSYCLNVLFLS